MTEYRLKQEYEVPVTTTEGGVNLDWQNKMPRADTFRWDSGSPSSMVYYLRVTSEGIDSTVMNLSVNGRNLVFDLKGIFASTPLNGTINIECIYCSTPKENKPTVVLKDIPSAPNATTKATFFVSDGTTQVSATSPTPSSAVAPQIIPPDTTTKATPESTTFKETLLSFFQKIRRYFD